MQNKEKIISLIDINLECVNSKIEFLEMMIKAFESFKELKSIEKIHEKSQKYINNISLLISLETNEILVLEKLKKFEENVYSKEYITTQAIKLLTLSITQCIVNINKSNFDTQDLKDILNEAIFNYGGSQQLTEDIVGEGCIIDSGFGFLVDTDEFRELLINKIK